MVDAQVRAEWVVETSLAIRPLAPAERRQPARPGHWHALCHLCARCYDLIIHRTTHSAFHSIVHNLRRGGNKEGIQCATCCSAGVLATQAQAETTTYRLELIREKSVQGYSRGGLTYTVDLSNGVLTLADCYAQTLLFEPVKSDGKITKSFMDPTEGNMEFIGLGNGEYELISPLVPCYYRLVQQ